MSWDIFVQDIPADITDASQIPETFRPAQIAERSALIRRIVEFEPTADFSDPACGTFDVDDFSIEFNLGECEDIESFALHIRGGHSAALFVSALLTQLGYRAFDSQSETGIFELGSSAVENLRKWRDYRDRVVK